MARIFYVHWNESEALERIAPLTKSGHDVRAHWSTGSSPSLKRELPDAVVISLDRLPSHGRAVAEWFWEAKSRRHIPIVFEGGKPDKVAVARFLEEHDRVIAARVKREVRNKLETGLKNPRSR